MNLEINEFGRRNERGFSVNGKTGIILQFEMRVPAGESSSRDLRMLLGGT